MKCMKITICLLILISALSAFGQKIVTSSSEEETIFIPNVTVIPEREWNVMIDALKAEKWDNAAFYASGLLRRLKVDNDKKQIARLRYFYLYSLAGQILKSHDADKQTQEEVAWMELKKATKEFTGKEFILPSRDYRSICDKNLNFICPVTNNEKAFRTAATNKDATAIHSFDYVLFENTIDLNQYSDKQIFLGGTLKRVEFNDDLTKPWVMYLIFERGFVRVVVEE